MAKSGLKESLWTTAQGLADQFGFSLVDVEIVKEHTGKYLRVYIDKTGGITLDDCEAYHRRFEPLVASVDYDFLEVCSPGLDRPLKTDSDYQKAYGTRIEVSLFKPFNGKRKLTGALISVTKDSVTLQTDGAGEISLNRKDISLAKPLIEFDEEVFSE